MGKQEYIEKTKPRIRFLIDNFFQGSQQAFADAAKISKASVSQYVNGTNTPGNITAGKIASVCHVEPLWVMGFDVPMTAQESPTDTEPAYTDQEKWIIHQYRGLSETGKEMILSLLRMLEEKNTEK